MKMNVEFKGLYHKTPHLFHQIKILMEVLLMTWTILSECNTTDVFDNSSPHKSTASAMENIPLLK